MYKKKLHYWAAVAKSDYKDKQWVMDKQPGGGGGGGTPKKIG